MALPGASSGRGLECPRFWVEGFRCFGAQLSGGFMVQADLEPDPEH